MNITKILTLLLPLLMFVFIAWVESLSSAIISLFTVVLGLTAYVQHRDSQRKYYIKRIEDYVSVLRRFEGYIDLLININRNNLIILNNLGKHGIFGKNNRGNIIKKYQTFNIFNLPANQLIFYVEKIINAQIRVLALRMENVYLYNRKAVMDFRENIEKLMPSIADLSKSEITIQESDKDAIVRFSASEKYDYLIDYENNYVKYLSYIVLHLEHVEHCKEKYKITDFLTTEPKFLRLYLNELSDYNIDADTLNLNKKIDEINEKINHAFENLKIKKDKIY